MTAQPKLDPRGFKRICGSCGNRFYDMNKRPIVCPSCDTEFSGVKVKTRRGKVANEKVESQVTKATENDDEDDLVADDDVISLDDAAELEGSDDDEDESIDLDDDLDDLDNLDDLDDDLDDDDLDADFKVGQGDD